MKPILKQIILAISITAVGILIVNYFFDKKDRDIIDNRVYSIAKIEKRYEYGEKAKGGKYGHGTSLESVDFQYTFNNKTYFENCPISDKNGFNTNYNDFLLIVHKNDPNKYLFLFDFPITDSCTFEESILKFENQYLDKIE